MLNCGTSAPLLAIYCWQQLIFKTMDELSIKAHIAAKTDVKNNMERLWTSIVVLKETVGLSESTMRELQAKISSKIAQCDRSIQDHQKLLSA